VDLRIRIAGHCLLYLEDAGSVIYSEQAWANDYFEKYTAEIGKE